MKVKNSIKKVGAVAGSALMVGLTMGSAAPLADYPQPFVDDDGNVASQIVVGSQGKVADVVGAVNVAAGLGQNAVQTETRSVSASGTPGWNANNGASLDTVNQKLYMGDDADSAKATLTSDDLDVLSSGTVTDSSGNTYDYDHYLYVGDDAGNAPSVDYMTEPSDSDPQTMLDVGDMNTNNGNNAFYHASTVFQDGLNTTLAAGENIELFDRSFQLSSDDSELSSSKLTLFGGGEDTTLEVGDSTTVTVDGTDFDVTLNGITDNDPREADLTINGNNYVKQDSSTLTVSDTTVFVDSVKTYTIPENTGSVTLSFGSEKLTLQDGSEVMTGSDDENVDGTYVSMTGNTDEISSIDVFAGVESTNSDEGHVAAGEQWEDPVFGTFSLAFGGLNPDTAGDEGEEISVTTSSDDDARVSFTTTDGDDATLNFAHYNSGISLADSNDNSYQLGEGDDVGVDEYTVIESGGFERLVQVTSMEFSNDGSSDGNEEVDVTFEDAVTGAEFEVNIDEGNDDGSWDGASADKIIDGQTYTVNVPSSVTIGTTSSYAVQFTDSDGATHDYSNGLETSNGGTTHLVGTATLSDVSGGDTIDLPTGTISVANATSTTQDDDTVQINNATGTALGTNDIEQVGSVWYAFSDQSTAGEIQVSVEREQDGTANAETLESNPGVFFVEEEEDASGTQEAYVVTANYDGSSNDDRVELGNAHSGANDAQFIATDTEVSNSLVQHDSDSDMASDVSTYGTHIEEDSSGAGEYVFNYPDNQAVAGAGVVQGGGSLTVGGGDTVEYDAVAGMGSLPDMARLDSEVTESVRSNNHLVLVGGPAVNTLVSELNDDDAIDLSDVSDAQSGAVLQGVDDAFASGQHALVVAGYGADDTRNAARYLSNYADHEQALDDAGDRMMLTEADYPASQ